MNSEFPFFVHQAPFVCVCEEPGGAGGLLIEDLHLAQVASAANICFLFVSAQQFTQPTWDLQVPSCTLVLSLPLLWPSEGRGSLSATPSCHSEALGGSRGCPRTLANTPHCLPSRHAVSLSPWGSSSWTLPHLGSERLLVHTLSPLTSQPGLGDWVDCFLWTLCAPPAWRHSGEPRWGAAQLPGRPLSLWHYCWLLYLQSFLSVRCLFREFQKSILKLLGNFFLFSLLVLLSFSLFSVFMPEEW